MTKLERADGNRLFDAAFTGSRVMAILRNFDPERTVELCRRAWSFDLSVVEVPIQDAQAHASLAAAAAAARDEHRLIGAGTVTHIDQVDFAADLGVAFTVAPGFDPRIARASIAAGMAHLPGVTTPSEIQAVLAEGLQWMKLFPAAPLGPGWLRTIRAPFPHARIVAVGGIDASNGAEFLAAGADVLGVGSALTDAGQMRLLRDLEQENQLGE